MAYTPQIIAPYVTGLDTDRDPWQLPPDAFSEIDNFHVHHGYIEKRFGYRKYGQMVHGTVITAATVANPAVFTAASSTGLANGVTVTLSGFTSPPDTDWDTLNNATYTITGLAGTNFSLNDSAGNPVDTSAFGAAYTSGNARVGYPVTNRIMGIFTYFSSTLNLKQNLIFDTRRAAYYSTASNTYQPIELTGKPNADFMSSSETDHIWATNWESSANTSRFYFTNGLPYDSAANTDGIFYYDTNSPRIVTRLNPAVNADGSTVLNGAKFLFVARKRLIALYTYENSNTYPQRMRVSKAGDPSNWDSVTPGNGKFADAATGEVIISARQLKDHIVVFFTNSVWLLKPTPNASNPFVWERLNSFRATNTRMGTVDFDSYVLSLGSRGIFATSASDTRRVDERIEDFADDEIYDAEFDKVYSARNYDYNRTWFLYPSLATSSTENDRALILDEDSKAFTTYSISMNVLGYGSTDKDLAAEDFTVANNRDWSAENMNNGETAFSFFWSNQEELFLGGDISGNIYELDESADDDGSPIECVFESAEWNPYKEQGTASQMGYVDIYFDSDELTEVTVEIYTDKNTAPYATSTVNLLPELNYVNDISNITTLVPSSSGVSVLSYDHGLNNGDVVYLYLVQGMEQINGLPLTVANATRDTFTASVDASAFSAYTGYGKIFRRQYYATKVWKRFFGGGIGTEHKIRLISSGVNRPLRIHSIKPYFRPRGRRTI